MISHPLVQYNLIVFDLDGSLRFCAAHHGPCHNGPDQWQLYADVPDVLAQYDWQKTAFGVASNQAGIGLGYISFESAWHEAMLTVRQALAPLPWPRRYVPWLCPHVPDAGCTCRKPAPGMLVSVMQEAQAPPAETLFVGDSLEDAQAADRAGCAFIPAWEFFGREQPVWATWTLAEREMAYRRVTATGEQFA